MSGKYKYEQNQEDAETKPFREYLTRLIQNDELSKYDQKVQGICQRYLDEYPKPLTSAQMHWVKKVEEDFNPGHCEQCGCPRSWQDALDDELLGGVCSSCYHDISKRAD
jgi:hypothetical protein